MFDYIMKSIELSVIPLSDIRIEFAQFLYSILIRFRNTFARSNSYYRHNLGTIVKMAWFGFNPLFCKETCSFVIIQFTLVIRRCVIHLFYYSACHLIGSQIIQSKAYWDKKLLVTQKNTGILNSPIRLLLSLWCWPSMITLSGGQ